MQDAQDTQGATAPQALPRRSEVLRDNRGWSWRTGLLVALVVLVVAAPPVVVSLSVRDTTHTMENIALLAAQETWLRQHNQVIGVPGALNDVTPVGGDAWKMPTRNGEPRVTKPPLFTWLTLASWVGLEPSSTSMESLQWRARMVSVVLAMMMLGAVFWLGVGLGDWKLGALAAVMLGTMWLFEKQTRYASYDIHMVAWVTLAMAAAIWAVRPLGPRPGRLSQAFFWVFAGVALGAAWLTKGPLAVVVTLLPLWAMAPLLGRRWWRMIVGSLVMLAVAAVVILPWHWYAIELYPRTWHIWFVEAKAKRDEFQPPWYYLALVALVLPWTLWVVAGLLQPFITARGERRRQLLYAFVWFAVVFVFFSIPGAKQQRYILPILPAAALLAAQVWRMHEDLAVHGRRDPGVELLRLPHWIGVFVVSAIFAPLMIVQSYGVEWGWFDKMLIGPMPWWLAAPGGLLLAAIALYGAKLHYQWKPLRAAVVMAAWMTVLMTLIWHAYSYNPSGVHPIRAQVEGLAKMMGDNPLIWVAIEGSDAPKEGVNEEFLIYTRRFVKEVWIDPDTPDGYAALDAVFDSVKDRDVLYIAASDNAESDAVLGGRGLVKIVPQFREDYHKTDALWLYDPQTMAR